MSYIVSWSGGKDCCFAYYQAINAGYEVSCLASFVSRQVKRVSFHGIKPELIVLQSTALDIPLLQIDITKEGISQEFKEAIRRLGSGVKGVIFGDIYSERLKNWADEVCGDLGIEAVEPLWGEKPGEITRRFINAGFEAIIVSAHAGLIDRKWVGQPVSMEFMAYLEARHLDRSGEYHTMVVDGPVFKQRIEIDKSAVVRRKTPSRGDYWFLDFREYHLVPKT